jgi:hypothetical protein
VARGSVTLEASDTVGKNLYPYGLFHAVDLDSIYDTEDASLFLLAVGRQGPPLAAKRIPLKPLSFPFTFEITSEDLLFPYTENSFKIAILVKIVLL